MIHTIKTILHEMGDTSLLIDVQPVPGGDISQAFEVRTENNHCFIKINRNAVPDFFQKEAYGLQQLRQAGALSVPQVYHVSPSSADHGYIVMEWVPTEPAADSETKLGRGLARLHQYTHTYYGLAENNYIGKLPQPNGFLMSAGLFCFMAICGVATGWQALGEHLI